MGQHIFFEKHGSGPALILVHGFPMNRLVWEPLIPELSKTQTVYTPDLPGFGKSDLLFPDFTIDDVAAALNKWVEKEGLQNAAIIGHSLGGYVVLAMKKQQPNWFRAIGLFHSTAYEDSAEKKDSRTKVLKFIDDNGVKAFTSNFIEPLFANPANPYISGLKAITITSSAEAVKGYTRAMRDRTDNTAVVTNSHKPVLIVGGTEDKGISVKSLEEQARLSPEVKLYVLPNVAHMGMYENREEVLRIFSEFLRSLVQ